MPESVQFEKSHRLNKLHYEIRGPIYQRSLELQSQGYKIINLNIGNPAPFGFETPDEIRHDIILNLKASQGYVDSKGIFPARKAVMQYYQTLGVQKATIDDIYIGNGVSELISIVMLALLNPEDEVLIPSPDYPLWTTAVGLSGGNAISYRCDEMNDWIPDIQDIERKITAKTRAIVVINPNNPTGAVYPKSVLEEIVKLAEKHQLILFSDEVYDKILYEGAIHHTLASMVQDTLCVTMNGLSKNYRAAGFRAAWMIFTGAKHRAKSYIAGLTFLASMRLCANAIAQQGIQTALGGYQSINDLVAKDGRLSKQMNFAHEKLSQIPGITCVKPKGALYLFPKIDLSQFTFKDDKDFVFSLLNEHHILVGAGQGFNFTSPDHFRIVFLPSVDMLDMAIQKIKIHLDNHRN